MTINKRFEIVKIERSERRRVRGEGGSGRRRVRGDEGSGQGGQSLIT